MQLFVYKTLDHPYTVLIFAGSQFQAIEKLSEFLDQHANLPRMEDWKMSQICGKLSDAIFTFNNQI